MHVAEREAAVCWKFGTLAAFCVGAFGLAGAGVAVTRKAVPHV